MRTVRALYIAIAVAGVLAAATPVIAQGPSTITGAPVVVTGQILPLLNVDPGTLERIAPIVEDGRRVARVDCVRDQVWKHEATLSDPRLSGKVTTSWNWDDFDEITDTSVAWGDMTIENDAGAWNGTFNGVEYPTGLMDTHAWLVGSGAYEGLAAFLSLQYEGHGPALTYGHDDAHGWGASGLLFSGMPPVMAMPLASR